MGMENRKRKWGIGMGKREQEMETGIENKKREWEQGIEMGTGNMNGNGKQK